MRKDQDLSSLRREGIFISLYKFIMYLFINIYMNMHTYMYVLVHMCVYIINNKINICPF